MENSLTAKQLREVLDYDSHTGLFRWKRRISIRITVGKIAGFCRGPSASKHVEIGIFGRNYLAHRLAWLWMTGDWPGGQVDHINMDGSNNRWSNLRLATHGQNVCNSGLRSNNTSGYKGVSYVRDIGKWHARIMSNRKLHLLGYFNTKEEAAEAYARASKRLHGEFARLK